MNVKVLLKSLTAMAVLMAIAHPQSNPSSQLRKMPYDSAFVQSLAGNYRIDPDRVISMGPMDEADGWLSFFDSQTRRAGILHALTDSVLITGPTFGVDFPISIRARILKGHDGKIRGLAWEESDQAPQDALRLQDIRQEDVTFSNGSVRLSGNLTLPTTAGPHPAVILIHGAGRTIPSREFGYWSAYLAGHGIAVLAFDKRGGGSSGGNAYTASYEDLADDVLAGLTMLQGRPEIDPIHIGLYGMSNGGYIAPLATARSNGRIAFIAVRSGSTRRVGDNIGYEVGNDLRSEGFSELEVERSVAIRRRVTDFVIDRPSITESSWDSLTIEVNRVSGEKWFPWARVAWVPRISPKDSFGTAFLTKLRSEWEYDPIPQWKLVRCPVYVMLGELDRSVPSLESASALRSALRAVADVNVRIFPNANHGLLEARTGFDREVQSLSHYVPDFQSSLVAFIKRVTLEHGRPVR
jgi:pimeloyl-ACP methyl ester carboxylesterase